MPPPQPSSGVHRLCPVCGSAGFTPHWHKRGLQMVRCLSCGMVYANPVPETLVTGGFYEASADSFYLSPAKLESDYAPVRFTRELRLFRRHCPSGSVLDVGCSTGAFLFQLQRLGGYAVAGTDVAVTALQYAQTRGIEVISEPFLASRLGERKFDAVTFWAVLEHVAEPRTFLNQATRCLKPGGFCFILVPNFRSLAVRLLRERYRYVMPEHLNYFTRNSLCQLVATTGLFEVVETRFTHFNPAVLWQDFWAGETTRVPDARRADLLQRTTALKQNPWLWPLRPIYAAMEGILARRHLADNLVLVVRKKQ